MMLSATVKSFALAAGTATFVLGSLSSARAFTVYTDRAAWQAAVDALNGVTTTDTFSTDIGSAQSILLDSGITSTNSPEVTLPNAFNNNSVSGGVYQNAAGGATASATITWDFPKSVFAFGADFISANSNGLTLSGNFDGLGIQNILVNNTIGGANGFLGVIGTANFSSIFFSSGNGVVDGFSIQNASFSSTPEPGTVMALGILGGGLFLSRRDKRG
ncbi:PEP-CTERM sorting domain-containing protein [Pannus brasiliensis CCIBt3594]|uniref:PEP-CTERM sorting domain-containing protein n=1 Tax=Pannus brasiliensis CCIBt3594 TaxID=1427578 RepID=A0AAW9QPN9_9CHRO